MAKVSIIGAGQVGATTAYTLAAFGLAQEIVLIDLNEQKARGEALDIAHGVPLCPPVRMLGGSDYGEIAGSDIVIFTAGVGQKPGETRLQLTARNLRVLESVCAEVTRWAPDCILLVVTNPVDVLTRAAIDMTGFPPARVIGSGTVLDTSRLRALLADHTGIDARNIHAYVLGEHGDSEFPAWSMLSIAGMNMREYCQSCDGCDEYLDVHMSEAFEEHVRRAAYKVIEQKGATFYAVALAVKRIVQAILGDEHSILTVSSLVRGEYGVDDVCLSLPCVIGASGVEKLLRVTLDEGETRLLQRSAEVIRATLAGGAGGPSVSL